MDHLQEAHSSLLQTWWELCCSDWSRECKMCTWQARNGYGSYAKSVVLYPHPHAKLSGILHAHPQTYPIYPYFYMGVSLNRDGLLGKIPLEWIMTRGAPIIPHFRKPSYWYDHTIRIYYWLRCITMPCSPRISRTEWDCCRSHPGFSSQWFPDVSSHDPSLSQ